MRKLITLTLAAASLATPAIAGAVPGKQHKARNVARMQCNQERRAIGVKQFRAKYGAPNAYSKCVKAHLPNDRAAAVRCRAERKSIGGKAFRMKYGRTPLKHCIALLATA